MNAANAADPIRDPVHRTSYTFRREGEDLWVETLLHQHELPAGVVRAGV
ncbi:MAG TPA: hypothetical protein VG365_10220 [Solirubrobacteraceae bacterium]|nr:hypothetical protein [Solirubrobacteraceae bacterium]